MREQRGTAWCLQNWQPEDYEDLLAWHNLCWFDPIFQEEDPQVRSWIAQDKGFTLEDRRAIYAKQREIMGRIVAQHKIMQERGQIEVTTTPYTHPILPLLANTDSGRVARPQMLLPRSRFNWPEDVRSQLLRGKENYQTRFGTEPRGLWPSEQSVSPAVLPEVAKAGFRWLVSDEGVLGNSLGHFFNRDDYGHVQAPDLLYRPYLIDTPAGPLSMVFRDHRLSDLIGFEYARRPAEEAARDFIEQLEAISRLLKAQKAAGPHLVTVALDGENCWEYYYQDGKPFLEALYARLSRHRTIKLVTVSEFLDKHGTERTLPLEKLHSGSWINADFTTWIGDPIKNRAWELLAQARQVLEGLPRATEASWEALWAAEGSDWFWWFGYGHSSQQDALFDQLFREHLQALYVSLGEAIPAPLKSPLERHDSPGSRVPKALIQPEITGYAFDQEWHDAGCYEVGGARGTMHRASSVQRLWYGADQRYFYLRLDFGAERPAVVQIYWFYPHLIHYNSNIDLRDRPGEGPVSYQFRHKFEIDLLHRHCQLFAAGEFNKWYPVPTSTRFALQECLEVAVPWDDLEITSGVHPQFVVVLARDGRFEAVIPETTTLEVQVP